MISRPTTTVSVLRDSDADAPARDVDVYGDEVETGAHEAGGSAVFTGEPAMIVEKQVPSVSDGDLRTVRQVIAHMRPDIDVRVGDRLLDAEGALYTVETVMVQRFSPTRLLDVRLELTRST